MPEETKKQIGKSLKELKEKVNAADSQVQAKLAPVVEKIEKRVNNPETEPEVSGTIADTIDEFEVEHPEVTSVLNNILHLLSNLGI